AHSIRFDPRGALRSREWPRVPPADAFRESRWQAAARASKPQVRRAQIIPPRSTWEASAKQCSSPAYFPRRRKSPAEGTVEREYSELPDDPQIQFTMPRLRERHSYVIHTKPYVSPLTNGSAR